MENMRFKVGDRVRIKSLDWYNENKGYTNSIWCEDGEAWFFYHMSQYCGKIMTVKNVWAHSYTLEGSDSRWTDEMIEGLVEEPTVFNGKEFLLRLANIELPSGTTTIWECPDGYQFIDENGNVINAQKIVLEKKKNEYPKTYEECCKVLNIEGGRLCFNNSGITQYERDLYIMMNNLSKLLICRDAYWKIAGEEMGLGKPWESDYTDPDQDRYAIVNFMGNIEKSRWDYGYSITFVFPTEEMRDAFYENFKELIETVKELL